jgi:CRP/FNR family transcriptional regulator, cyclic AMP receptor protein
MGRGHQPIRPREEPPLSPCYCDGMALGSEEKRAWLERVELFSGCSPAALNRLAGRLGETEFAAGQRIVSQGQVGSGLFIIVSGRARVVRGQEPLASVGPGDFFGELAVIEQQPRMASVIAEERTTCLALASWDLIEELRQDPELALNLLRELARRLRTAQEQHRH